MIYLLYALHIIVCLFLILVVLLQQGKGADLSVFGGGSTQTAFGARGAATLLHKLTVASFIAFIITTVGIAAIQGRGLTSGDSLLSNEPVEQAPASGVPAADTIPETSTPEEGAATETPAGADESTMDESGAAAPQASAEGGDQAGGDDGQQAP